MGKAAGIPSGGFLKRKRVVYVYGFLIGLKTW